VGSGVLSRAGGEENLTVATGERRDRRVRLRIVTRDDQPIGVAKLVFEIPARLIKFSPAGPGEYWIYHGATQARAPQYDLVRILDREFQDVRVSIMPGAEERNPAYEEGAGLPWTERHPSILYSALAVAVAAIAALTIRAMIKMKGIS
jgi:hypothetical protein